MQLDQNVKYFYTLRFICFYENFILSMFNTQAFFKLVSTTAAQSFSLSLLCVDFQRACTLHCLVHAIEIVYILGPRSYRVQENIFNYLYRIIGFLSSSEKNSAAV